MNNENYKEFDIPEYTSLKDLMSCSKCKHYNLFYNKCKYCTRIKSKYDCVRFTGIILKVKLFISLLVLVSLTVLTLMSFKNFWSSLYIISWAFISIMILHFLSDKVLKYFCIKSEQKRREKYDKQVQELEAKNEAIRRVNLGITEELQKFLDYSVFLLNGFTKIFKALKKNLHEDSVEEKRVLIKFENVIQELMTLNENITSYNYETTSIPSLYYIHLTKLLEYSNTFQTLLESKKLTQQQIIEFSNLLEVFRVKLYNYVTYLKDKSEDDFIVKILALNKDIMPEYDGGTNND